MMEPDRTAHHRPTIATPKRFLPAMGASAVLHLLLLAATALIVWRVAVSASAPPQEVFITFEEPGRGRAIGPAPSAPLPSAPTPSPASTVPPAAPPSLTSTIDAGDPGRAAPTLSSPAASPAADPITSLAPAPPAVEAVRFAGLGASSARSVVYVVDGSGPMVSSLPLVLAEVQRSVDRLSPSQRFAIIVFRRVDPPKPGDPGADDPSRLRHTDEANGPGYLVFTPALVRATPEARLQVATWLNAVKPRGRSNPLDGLRAAIAMQPDVVFILSRSIARSGGGVWELGLERTMAELDRLNPVTSNGRRRVVIKTLQFLDDDPTGILQAIGKVHGGSVAAAAPANTPAAPPTATPTDTAGSYRVIRSGAELSER